MQLYREALGVYFGPFDEDYGYVTIEGLRRVAAGRHPDRQRWAARVRPTTTRPGLVRPPEPKAIAEAFDRLWRDRDGAERMGARRPRRSSVPRCPRWPDIVARLLD